MSRSLPNSPMRALAAAAAEAPTNGRAPSPREAELAREVATLRKVCAQLERERERDREHFEAAPLAYVVLQADGRIAEANRAAAALLGLRPGEPEPRRFVEFLQLEDRAELEARLREPAGATPAWLCRVRLSVPDGTLRTFRLEGAGDGLGQTRVMLVDITDRQREAELQSQHLRRLESIVAASGGAVWEVDFSNDTAYYSPAFHALLGLPDGSLGNARAAWRKYGFEEDLPAVRKLFEDHIARADPQPYRGQFRMRRADGTTLTVISAGRVTEWTEDGQPLRMVGCYLDISAQADAEAAARASGESLRTVIDNLRAAVVLKDRLGRWIVVGRPGRELLQLDERECLGLTSGEVLARRPDLAPLLGGCDAGDERAWAAGTTFTYEEQIPTETGPRTLELTKIPLFEADGTRRGLVVVIEDVTERRKAEAHLQERDAQFTALTTHAPGMLYEFRLAPDGSASLPYVSAHVRRMYGEEPEDVMRDAHMLFRHVLPEDLAALNESIRRSAETMTTWQFDYRIRHVDGSLRWLRGASTPRRLDDGSIQWSGYKYDITQLKLAETEQLNRGKREVIERLAGGVAHDFNNYLTSIRVSAELLGQRAAGLSTGAAELAETLLGEIDAATRVARQLLAFTKDQPIRREVVPLAEFLHKTSEFALRGSGVSAGIAGAEGLELETDPILLQQALFNLLINAREAMNHRGRIELEVRRGADGSIQVRIGDEGPGVPPGRQEQIFELYYTTKPDGSGLGLHVARSLLARLGGTIALDASVARGAAFVVSLPSKASSPEHSPRPSAPAGALAPRAVVPHVLLLEDEEVQTFLLTRFLRDIGVTCEAFTCGAALLEAAGPHEGREAGALVCLLDITVRHGLGGLEIARELRARLPRARIFLVSGYTDAWDTYGASLGAIDIGFISKPYTLPTLRELLLGVAATASAS
ncbi:MAG: PAS domain-containing protein [Verrucomicrobia bacterium]|nr:PAS domain-containing protein [Verrucomicrobiota bacterium]